MKNPLRLEARGEREVFMTRDFDAPRHLVFEALTKPELLRRWFFGPPGWALVVCEIDFRVGGTFRYVWRYEDGVEMGMRGTYREIVPGERIVTADVFDEDWTGGETIGTLALYERNGRTTLTSTIVYSSPEARDQALKSGMEGGLAAGYDRLEEVLASISSQDSIS